MSACTEIRRSGSLNFCRTVSLPLLPEPLEHPLRQQGAGKVVALAEDIAITFQILIGLPVLHALEAHGVVHALGGLDGGVGEDAVGPLPGDLPHEALVQLDLLDGQAKEQAEGRRARAKIVQRQADALPPEGLNGLAEDVGIQLLAALRQLQAEVPGREALLPQNLQGLGQEIPVLELAHGDIDVQDEVRAQGQHAPGVADGPAQDPEAQLKEAGVILQPGEEAAGTHLAPEEILPVEQGLGAHGLPIPGPDNGLIAQQEALPVPHGVPVDL